MKYVLGLVLVLTLSTMVWAQGGEGAGECTFNTSAEDHTCNGSNGYVSVQFQPPCDGEYRFECKIVCNAYGDVTDSKVVATIKRLSDGATIAVCDNVLEEPPGYCENPEGDQIVTLDEGVTYRLMVYLDNCYSQTCDDANCYAYARLHRAG